MSSEEDIYEVGEVLKDRKKRGQIEYLIRWKNFGVEEDSWEPASNLQNAGSILQDYIKNKALRKSRRSSSRSRSRSRSRTRLPRKKAEKEAGSRESTPLKKSSREGTPLKKREPTPIKSLESSTPIEEDLEKASEKEATPPPPPEPSTEEEPVPPPVPEDVPDTSVPKVVTELTNEGVEETPLTTFTSQITTETTEILTPVSESVSTVLTRRMEMRAAAKASELEEEKIIEEQVMSEILTKEVEPPVEEEEERHIVLESQTPDVPVAEPDPVDPVPSSDEEPVLTKTASAPSEQVASVPRHTLLNISANRKWPIILFVVCLLVIGISFLVEKYLRS